MLWICGFKLEKRVSADPLGPHRGSAERPPRAVATLAPRPGDALPTQEWGVATTCQEWSKRKSPLGMGSSRLLTFTEQLGK